MSQAAFGFAGEGHDPSEMKCEWCSDDTTATRKVAVRRGRSKSPTGQYLYACDKHYDIAYRSVNGSK